MQDFAKPPSRTEHLVDVLCRTSTQKHVSPVEPITVRLPYTILAAMDAMAEISDTSRVSVMTQLLYIALESTAAQLQETDQEVYDRYQDRAGHYLNYRLQRAGHDVETI